MKKIIIIFLLFALISFGIYFYINKNSKGEEKITVSYEMKAIFVSYIDYSGVLKNKTKEEKMENIDKIIYNSHSFGFNTILLQVRPFADAIYNSNYFKPSITVSKNEDTALDLDILSYFIKKTHEKNMKIHAWINPYRIRTSNDTSTISKSSIFYDWLETNDIEVSKSGIYFNPASEQVLAFILNGVKEIVTNYNIDGILYDDYFYPNETIDLISYEEYINSGGTLTIEDYRYTNINNLIKNTYKEIKSIKSNVLFGISPAGNISNNKHNEYLDIEFILKQNDYLDYVMPQLYYGFNNSAKPFLETVNVWNNLISNDIKLYPALSIYKAGLEDSFAGTGSKEWQ